MGHWTQYDEDKARLPEGFKRIAYDADTQQYTYRDRDGRLYEGEPGSEFGTLKLKQKLPTHRPMFEGNATNSPLGLTNSKAPASFHDILSPQQLTTASPLPSEKATFPNAAFKDAVRRTTMPKMQGMVESVMKRSATLSHRSRSEKFHDPDADSMREQLLPQGMPRRSLATRPDGTSSLKRSHSSASSRSTASTHSSMTTVSSKTVRESNVILPSFPSIPANALLPTMNASPSQSGAPPRPPSKGRHARVATFA